MEKTFEKQSFAKRLKTMLRVDARRMLCSPFFYLMVGIAFVIPILILVMTSMMEGSVSTDPNGNQTVMEGFENVWQILGSVSSTGGESAAGMSMDLVSMCNVNMMYFLVAFFVCVFVSEDFKSGYAKNLFTVRAKKTDYVISKTLWGFVAGAVMLIAFFLGAMVGGGVAKLSFDMQGFHAGNVVAAMLAKIFICLIFAAVCVLAGVAAKQRAWLSVILALGFSMLFFTMIPMITPLDSTAMHVLLCFCGGALFGAGIGIISKLVLEKTSIL